MISDALDVLGGHAGDGGAGDRAEWVGLERIRIEDAVLEPRAVRRVGALGGRDHVARRARAELDDARRPATAHEGVQQFGVDRAVGAVVERKAGLLLHPRPELSEPRAQLVEQADRLGDPQIEAERRSGRAPAPGAQPIHVGQRAVIVARDEIVPRPVRAATHQPPERATAEPRASVASATP